MGGPRPLHERVGIVAIGRNEGERLRRCLDSLSAPGAPVVYVDSGSTDGSRELAVARGVTVVDLDLERPFTAARARNAGFAALIGVVPRVEFVFFLDGDCELVDGFLEQALRAMDGRRDRAVVCGRRVERFPEASLYNRLADMEWNTPVGEADSCGGDALFRASVFRQEGGYDPSLISGEEPELCLRLRRRGFKVLRLDADMTRHDAAMTRFAQWWNRALRTGHAALERLWMHGLRENPVHLRRVRSALFWSVGLPVGTSALALTAPLGVPALAWCALLPAGWSLLVARVARHRLRRGDPLTHALPYAVFCLLGKLPELVGMVRVASQRLRGVEARWIEYKDVVPLAPDPDPEPAPRPQPTEGHRRSA